MACGDSVVSSLTEIDSSEATATVVVDVYYWLMVVSHSRPPQIPLELFGKCVLASSLQAYQRR